MHTSHLATHYVFVVLLNMIPFSKSRCNTKRDTRVGFSANLEKDSTKIQKEAELQLQELDKSERSKWHIDSQL